ASNDTIFARLLRISDEIVTERAAASTPGSTSATWRSPRSAIAVGIVDPHFSSRSRDASAIASSNDPAANSVIVRLRSIVCFLRGRREAERFGERAARMEKVRGGEDFTDGRKHATARGLGEIRLRLHEVEIVGHALFIA